MIPNGFRRTLRGALSRLAPGAFLGTAIALAHSSTARAGEDDAPLAPLAPPAANALADNGPLKTERRPYPKLLRELPYLEVTAQLGFSLPMGKISSADPPLGSVVSGQVPLWFEVGPRLTRHLFVGAYGSIAFGTAAGDFHGQCAHGANTLGCGTTTTRLGLATRVRFRPDTSVMPWVGYALGYESMSMDLLSASGIEFAHLSAGADVRAREDAVFGPALDLGIGQYAQERSTAGGSTDSGASRAVHAWLTLGIRGTLSL